VPQPDKPAWLNRLTSRLAFKLTAWVGLSVLVMVSLAAVVGIKAQEDNAIGRVSQSGSWFSDTVKRSTRHAMLKDQRDSVHAIIEAVGKQEGVDVVRVFNKKGQIMFSSRAAEIGQLVDMQAEACYACHFKDQPLERLPQGRTSRIFNSLSPSGTPSHRVLGVINPIYTEPACYTDPCHAHPPDQSVLGVLDVNLSLAQVDAEVSATTRQVVVFALVVFALLGGIVALFTFHFVNQPLRSLAQETRRIAQGDYDHQVKPLTGDEIGELAQSFETMRRAVKEKTEALHESRQQFQILFEQVPCHITVQDRDLRLVGFNKMFEREFGARMGEHCYEAYKGRRSKCPTCAVERTFADGQIHSAEETTLGQDGKPRYILNLTAPIRDKSGAITAVMEMATDITAIRLLEDELRRSEEKYRLFFNNAPNPILVFDHDTLEILDANDRATADYRYPKEELLGRSVLDLTDPADQHRVRGFLERGESFLPRVCQARRDGTSYFVNIRASYGEHLGRRACIATTADITQMLKTEEQLVQAAKMATLGEMSTGVAHEINQPLTVIGTAGHFLAKQAERGISPELAVLKDVARELISQVSRAERIINHLREFGRKSRVERERLDINSPVRRVFHLLGQQLHLHDIEVRLDLAEDLPLIWGEPNRLEQVFINLVLNARDAIEDRRDKETGLDGAIQVRTWCDNDRVLVSVADNGFGIPDEIKSRIFEPFFTTKEVGRGTGLGLSISYGIVRDYGGRITVDSESGRGTTFVVSFERAGEEEA